MNTKNTKIQISEVEHGFEVILVNPFFSHRWFASFITDNLFINVNLCRITIFPKTEERHYIFTSSSNLRPLKQAIEDFIHECKKRDWRELVRVNRKTGKEIALFDHCVPWNTNAKNKDKFKDTKTSVVVAKVVNTTIDF